MTCPYCGKALPDDPQLVGILTICPNPKCLRTLAIDGGVRVTSGEDTTGLSPDDLTKLRALRKALRTA